MSPFPRPTGFFRCLRFALALALALGAAACRGRAHSSAVALPENTTSSDAAAAEPALEIEDLRVGTGAAAAIGKRVSIHYSGWVNGAKFDTSLGRKPLEFRLGKGEVLGGWDQGIPGMKTGGRRKLTVPPRLGYGDKGSLGGAIPPRSVLVFDIELVDVKD